MNRDGVTNGGGVDERINNMKHLFCNNPQEIKKVNEIIEETDKVLYDFAVNDEEYYKYTSLDQESHLYFKKVNNVDVGKLTLVFHDATKLERLIELIWDENGAKKFDPYFIEGKILRVYNKDLILLQQSYRGTLGNEGRYFYILVHKKKIDNDTYLISCASVNVDDQKKNQSTFTNPLVSSANTLSLDIECDEQIKNASLRKMFVNVSGYYIKREEDHLNFTYISSIELDTSSLIPQFIIRKVKASKMTQLQTLKNYL
ncbi:hypothetical protein PCYB_125150 [Plasmodium cynomolgi strain B]|uniref:START domain-containing protein n=1 Tax=Plasmodium cynomolgi (strain B) TaxID=1120755 RepID=K6UWC8_PLACD|nr:hypothetical protein PCYB_125150 [Plasmodium cynomolgi strain B]GAB67949.1 hypothetical protein PCYB_125150 [Plasmodium cynomolgi strain B]